MFVAPPAFLDALTKQGIGRLLLIAPQRMGAHLRDANGTVGSGTLEGLGFYIDTVHRYRRSDTQESAIGFLAPYAKLRIVLIDMTSSKVLKFADIDAGSVMSAARSTTGANPWSVLGPAEKVAALTAMLKDEVPKAVHELLRAPQAAGATSAPSMP